jgi:hypothetical protein
MYILARKKFMLIKKINNKNAKINKGDWTYE